MNWKTESVYTRVCNKTKIMAYWTGHEWEVYYKRKDYPFMYAFGILEKESPDYVLDLAEANIGNHAFLFN